MNNETNTIRLTVKDDHAHSIYICLFVFLCLSFFSFSVCYQLFSRLDWPYSAGTCWYAILFAPLYEQRYHFLSKTHATERDIPSTIRMMFEIFEICERMTNKWSLDYYSCNRFPSNQFSQRRYNFTKIFSKCQINRTIGRMTLIQFRVRWVKKTAAKWLRTLRHVDCETCVDVPQ